MKKAAVFCSHGLGDGLLFLIISNNLKRNGYLVDTYHNFLHEIDHLIENSVVQKYPQNFKQVIDAYDLIIINSDHLNKKIVEYTKEKYPESIFSLHPSTCKSKGPILGDFRFDMKQSMVQNLVLFCENTLNLKDITSENGLVLKNNNYRKKKNRVIIHPSSKDRNRNWPKKKYQHLANKLKKCGFNPYFIIAEDEKDDFKDFADIYITKSLESLAEFIYESGYMIGNDSGIGHLASNLKIPTLTIFATKRKQYLWKPDWYYNEKIVPFSLINIKGIRLRDKYWYKTITVSNVLKRFIKLARLYESSSF